MKINFWGLEVGSEAIDEVKPKGMTLFILYTSSYVLVLVLKRNVEVSTIKGELLQMAIFILCFIVSIVSFTKLSGIVFRYDNSFEEYEKKNDYMKRTLKKFKEQTSENIEKNSTS